MIASDDCAAAMNQTAYERYQSKPFSGSSHNWAISKIAGLPPDTRVLDVGPGSGVMGKALLAKGIRTLCAVEIDSETCKLLADTYTRIESTIEPFISEKFDLIILLDVLEHMVDPESFLKQVAGLLSERGIILISLPNIAHWSIRLPLLFGFFEYTNRGILDRSHCQFFTRRRLAEMLKNIPGVAIEEEDASIPPIEFLLPQRLSEMLVYRLLRRIHIAVARALPGLFSYQHLVMLRVKEPYSRGTNQNIFRSPACSA